jgi:hypothetical protein
MRYKVKIFYFCYVVVSSSVLQVPKAGAWSLSQAAPVGISGRN